jgi:hypothetical protein
LYNLFEQSLPSWFSNVCLIAQVSELKTYSKTKINLNIWITQLFASANAAINPIVTFRKTFAHLLPKLINSKRGINRISPFDIEVIQQHIDKARPSSASNNTQKQVKDLSNGFNSNTTSFTKQIMMKRVPQIFLRDDTWISFNTLKAIENIVILIVLK